jgi:hypothetical protein
MDNIHGCKILLNNYILNINGIRMSQPQSYIIVENDDGTFTAYVNFGNYISKEEAEQSLNLAMEMLGLQVITAPTIH